MGGHRNTGLIRLGHRLQKSRYGQISLFGEDGDILPQLPGRTRHGIPQISLLPRVFCNQETQLGQVSQSESCAAPDPRKETVNEADNLYLVRLERAPQITGYGACQFAGSGIRWSFDGKVWDGNGTWTRTPGLPGSQGRGNGQRASGGLGLGFHTSNTS